MLRHARVRASVRRVIICTVLLIAIAGCSSSPAIRFSDTEAISSQVSIGQLIEVTQLDGSVSRFHVREITNDGIGGDDYFIKFDDIDHVTVVQPESTREERVRHELQNAFIGIMLGIILFVALW